MLTPSPQLIPPAPGVQSLSRYSSLSVRVPGEVPRHVVDDRRERREARLRAEDDLVRVRLGDLVALPGGQGEGDPDVEVPGVREDGEAEDLDEVEAIQGRHPLHALVRVPVGVVGHVDPVAAAHPAGAGRAVPFAVFLLVRPGELPVRVVVAELAVLPVPRLAGEGIREVRVPDALRTEAVAED